MMTGVPVVSQMPVVPWVSQVSLVSHGVSCACGDQGVCGALVVSLVPVETKVCVCGALVSEVPVVSMVSHVPVETKVFLVPQVSVSLVPLVSEVSLGVSCIVSHVPKVFLVPLVSEVSLGVSCACGDQGVCGVTGHLVSLVPQIPLVSRIVHGVSSVSCAYGACSILSVTI